MNELRWQFDGCKWYAFDKGAIVGEITPRLTEAGEIRGFVAAIADGVVPKSQYKAFEIVRRPMIAQKEFAKWYKAEMEWKSA